MSVEPDSESGEAARSQLLERLRQLEAEKQSILAQLREHDAGARGATLPPVAGVPARAETPSDPAAKIGLFLELFRCRPDLYAKLWEHRSADGKVQKGYVPVLTRAWQGKVGKKAKRGYDSLPPEAFLPLDETAARDHLEGRQTIGTYAIRRDDSCVFLAADFDDEHWEGDVAAYVQAARELGAEAALERSRSGQGGHAWIFFSRPVPARLARKLGTLILARASASRSQIKLSSYDRLFPNQDNLPKGGFGNLIALPLQKMPRQAGNSVFLDGQFQPHADQWGYLAGLRRLGLAELEAILAPHEIQDSSPIPPVEKGLKEAERILDQGLDARRPLEYTGKIELTLSNGIRLGMSASLPSGLVSAFKRSATFANPVFFERQQLRFSTYNTPRYIFCGENLDGDLWLPRGCLDDCLAWASEAGAEVELKDARQSGAKRRRQFEGELDAQQKRALKALAAHDTGVLVAPPGTGKTVVACALIAKRKVSTLILVHRAPLLEQWKARLKEFLGLKDSDIGVLGGQRRKLTGALDVAMIQSLGKLKPEDPLFSGYGQVIVDECHHLPALTFESVMKRFSSRYVAGLTATPFRRDGLQKIIYLQCGPLRHEVPALSQNDVERKVHFRETSFRLSADAGAQPALHLVWSALAQDPARTRLIAWDVAVALEAGRFPLVLSERKDHLEILKDAVQMACPSVRSFTLIGQMGKKERRQVLDEIAVVLASGGRPCLFATGSFIGEGFDLPALDTLFLAMPVAFKGKVIQYAGRLHRAHPGKSVVEIYDYLDSAMALTVSMWRKRAKAYKGMGYETPNPDCAGAQQRLMYSKT
ncbi:MAG TPA: DEAD/DEAH box helicase family protein [bacterium]|jgi:superfamily II DNA or RNA helicase|nr:DEAD/DEAH box helicase family protein [bacterium]